MAPIRSSFTILFLALVLFLFGGCHTHTMHVAPDSSRPAGTDSYDEPAGSRRSQGEPGGKAFPPCTDPSGQPLAPVSFPASTDDADYRAIVQITIGSTGEALDPCFRAVEGPLELEEKALAERSRWKFDPAFAGQKRDRTITYRLRRPE